MPLVGKCFPGKAGMATLESWKKGEMSPGLDGRSFRGLLVGREQDNAFCTALHSMAAVMLSTQSAGMPALLGNVLL